MLKCVLMNRFDFDNLKLNIKLADHLEFTYEFESMPLVFPCIAVYHYYVDVDYGACYRIVFVYGFELAVIS